MVDKLPIPPQKKPQWGLPTDIVPPPICSVLGRHYINNPEGNTCVKCKHCMQWFRWDWGEHKYIPL